MKRLALVFCLALLTACSTPAAPVPPDQAFIASLKDPYYSGFRNDSLIFMGHRMCVDLDMIPMADMLVGSVVPREPLLQLADAATANFCPGERWRYEGYFRTHKV